MSNEVSGFPGTGIVPISFRSAAWAVADKARTEAPAAEISRRFMTMIFLPWRSCFGLLARACHFLPETTHQEQVALIRRLRRPRLRFRARSSNTEKEGTVSGSCLVRAWT